ncbi:cell division protein FtsA [bacterium]|nr:cell division protein FtsA [bacterium]
MDIGSTKITSVVGEVHPSRGLILRGLSSVPTEAVIRGAIRDLNQATHDIDKSYSGAMYSSGLNTNEVFVGITGKDLFSLSRRANVSISNDNDEVLERDLDKVLRMTMPTELDDGQRVVHSMVREYCLDGVSTMRSPVGMIGNELEVESHIVIGSANQIANIERALNRVDLEVNSFVFNLIAAGEAVLSAEDKTAGCILIDFGGGTTNVGIYNGGTLSYSACIGIGGNNYDHDLKRGLGISFEEALRIKKSYGRAWVDEDSDELEDFIDVKFFGRPDYDKIKRRKLYEILQPRTDELVERIIVALQESGQLDRISGGVVMVGGGCLLRDLRKYLQKHLQRQVRVGIPTGIANLLDEYRSPSYAATLGLLLYGARYGGQKKAGDESLFNEVLSVFTDMIQGLLKRFRRNGRP